MLLQGCTCLLDGEVLRLGRGVATGQPDREEGKASQAEACAAMAQDYEGTQRPETEKASVVVAQTQLR